MKLATVVSPATGGAVVALVDTLRGQALPVIEACRLEGVVPLQPMATMLDVIDHWPALEPVLARLSTRWPEAAALPLASARFLAPLEPRQMRDCMAFEQHLLNAYAQAEKRDGVKRKIPGIWYKQPIYYKTNRFSVAGHQAVVTWPRYSSWMDFELEFAAIIGTRGRDIAPEAALGHIFGYTVFNDFSARDAQLAEMSAQLGPAKGKDFDGGNVLGPWIVTADEIGDPHALAMEVRVNGERWGGGNSSEMYHRWPAILAHISAAETLHPGEVIGSGTVGTGCGLELGRKLSDGDVVELTIEKIGSLSNTVRSGRSA